MEPVTGRRVVVLMSGGVDSSVAAALLQEQGAEVIGVTLRLLDGAAPPGSKGCCSYHDVHDARRVAQTLGIRHYVLDVSPAFRRGVIEDFVSEYRRGRTPNPCVRCNERIKFDHMWQVTRELGAEGLATGHYARIVRDAAGRAGLYRGADPDKDQSYFLYAIPRAVLEHVQFPVGALPKTETRAWAARFSLPVADKPDSQEVCFTHGQDYRPQLGLPDTPGVIRDASGSVVGRHQGIWNFTVGQRRGLGLGGGGLPLYVTALDMERNTVMVGPAESVTQRALEASEVHWLADPPGPEALVWAQIRSRHQPVQARVSRDQEDRLRVDFGAPQWAVTPGQRVVLYDGDRVLGGAIIERGLRETSGDYAAGNATPMMESAA